MTTHEIEKMLGLTKQAIIYYEKEGLIKPKRDENNYRHYTQKEVDELKLIQLLRSMDLSIDDIKLIFNHQLSIREALENQQEFIKQSKIKLENIDQRITDYIQRKKVKISFDHKALERWMDYDTLYFNQNEIKYNDIILLPQDIKSIDISMCSSIDFVRNIISIYMSYYVDIDIHTAKNTYSFQILNNDQILLMFQYFNQYHIFINDPLSLEKLYREKTDDYTRVKYLDIHFKKWAKQYHLDNPRDNWIEETIKKNYQKNKDKIMISKKIFNGDSDI